MVQVQLKRLDNVSRSPLFSHLTATLQGLATIHAFDKGQDFISEFHLRLDRNLR